MFIYMFEFYGSKLWSKLRIFEFGVEVSIEELFKRGEKIKFEVEVVSLCGDIEEGGDDFDVGV